MGADTVPGGGHGWAVEPPLTPAELAELEGQLRVELPGEHRSFLLQVSRGGADEGGFQPLRDDDGTPLGFARWYRRSLAEAEQHKAGDWSLA